MVGMRVTENDHIEVLATSRTEHGEHGGPAGVHRTSNHSARVDEPGASIRKVQKRRVALAHVDGRHAQDALRSTGAPARELDEPEPERERKHVGGTERSRERRTRVAARTRPTDTTRREETRRADSDEREVKTVRLRHTEG